MAGGGSDGARRRPGDRGRAASPAWLAVAPDGRPLRRRSCRRPASPVRRRCPASRCGDAADPGRRRHRAIRVRRAPAGTCAARRAHRRGHCAFAYDAAGRLTTVTDDDGDATHRHTIERNGAGAPIAIVAPRRAVDTALTLDGDGWLASVAGPGGRAARAHLRRRRGLMTRLTDSAWRRPRLRLRRRRTADPRQARRRDQTLTRTTCRRAARSRSPTPPAARRPTRRSSTTSARSSTRSPDTGGADDGHRARARTPPSAPTSPDGTTLEQRAEPDPRFGMLAPMPPSARRARPAGATHDQDGHPRVHDAHAGRAQSQIGHDVRRQRLRDRRSYAAPGDTAGRSRSRAPGGRVTTTVLDGRGRITSTTPVAGVTPLVAAYDDATTGGSPPSPRAPVLHLRLRRRHRITSRTDATGRELGYTYDAADRLSAPTVGGETWTLRVRRQRQPHRDRRAERQAHAAHRDPGRPARHA